MPDTVSPDLLQDVLDGAKFASLASPESELAALARSCRTLRIGGPDAAAERRLHRRIGALSGDPGVGRPGEWWSGWFGPAPLRPLAQRLAAGGLVLTAMGGGASAATGVTPTEFASDFGATLHSIVVNLDPRDSGSTGPLQSPTPDPPATPAPTQAPASSGTVVPTPLPSASPSAAPSASSTPDDNDDDDDSGSGNSSSGSSNSGSGSDDDVNDEDDE